MSQQCQENMLRTISVFISEAISCVWTTTCCGRGQGGVTSCQLSVPAHSAEGLEKPEDEQEEHDSQLLTATKTHFSKM